MLNIFKKKAKPVEDMPKRMDFSKYDIRFTIKAICLFERLSGKSFYGFTDEDLYTLAYALFVTSNDFKCKLSTFKYMFEDKRFAEWIGEKINEIMNYMGQFSDVNTNGSDEKGENKEEEAEVLTITSIANSLIVQYGVDPHWVMNEMELWQIAPAFEAVDAMIKNRYEEERLWTYLEILPHIDGKKLNKPEKLLPFPWEAEKKKTDAQKRIKENEYAVKHTIGMKIDYLKN